MKIDIITRDEFEALAARVDALENVIPPPPPPPPPPVHRAVLTKADFVAAYRGRWSVPEVEGPKASEGGHDCRRFGFSTAVHDQLADGRVGIAAHIYDLYGYATVLPPKPTRDAIPPLAQAVEWHGAPVPPIVPEQSGTEMRGWLETAGGAYRVYSAFYAVSATDFPSQSRDGQGCFRVAGPEIDGVTSPYTHNMLAGYTARPPAGMDADYLIGLCGTCGDGISSAGPSLYAVRWNDGSPMAQRILGYSSQDGIALPGWDHIMQARGAAWIETPTKHAIVFAMRRGIGQRWYGPPERTIDGVTYRDPWEGNQGQHAEEYERGLLIYDPDNLAAGPVEWIDLLATGWLDVPGHTSNHSYCPTCSYRDGKLIVGIRGGVKVSDWEAGPMFLEFQFER